MTYLNYNNLFKYKLGDTLYNFYTNNPILQGICCGLVVNDEKISGLGTIKEEIKSLELSYNYETKYIDCHFKWFDVVSNFPSELANVEWQTKEICKIAIKNDPFSIEHVNKQQRKIICWLDLCDMAIKINPRAIFKIKYPHSTSCELALSLDGLLLKDVIKHYQGWNRGTAEFHLISFSKEAITQNRNALFIAPVKNSELCRLAVTGAEIISLDIAKIAVSVDGLLLEIVLGHFLNNGQTTPDSKLLIELAVRQNYLAFDFVQDKTLELCEAVVKINGWCVILIKNPSQELLMMAVRQNGLVLSEIEPEVQTEEICLAAVSQYAWAYKFAAYKTEKVREAAIKNCPSSINT